MSALAVTIRPLSAAQSWGGLERPDSSIIREPRVDAIACTKRAIAASEIAVVDFKGDVSVIVESDRVYATLNQITTNPRIAAIALRIDSSGGDSYGSNKLYEALHKAKPTCALSIAAFIGNVGTSGAFWLALAADEVHAAPLSTLGGVGVLATYVDERDAVACQPNGRPRQTLGLRTPAEVLADTIALTG